MENDYKLSQAELEQLKQYYFEQLKMTKLSTEVFMKRMAEGCFALKDEQAWSLYSELGNHLTTVLDRALEHENDFIFETKRK